MALHRYFSRSVLVAVCAVSFASMASAQIDITTQRYDNGRLGANLSETQLSTTNVSDVTFGKLWSYTVSGSVYAQPLYVRNVNIAGNGARNVLYVVTMNDIVYAFDADSSTDTPLASFDLTTLVPGSTPLAVADIGTNIPGNIVGNVGIESTPVIDLATNTMYLLARTREPGGACGVVGNPEREGYADGSFCQRLHALDIATLAEKPGSPVVISGGVMTVPGNDGGDDDGTDDGTLHFNPRIHDQRASLALANGRIFIAWGSHRDSFNFHGWVMSYDAATLQQTSIRSVTPDGSAGGIWMAGRAPAVDADGNVYFMSGNGYFPEDFNGTTNFCQSFLKFGSTADSPLLDYFTPAAWQSLSSDDMDIGGSGPMLLPGTDLIVGGGKHGDFYLTHTQSPPGMGQNQPMDAGVVQSFSNGVEQQIKGGPVYWNRSGGLGPWMYVWSDNANHLNAYHFNGTTFDTAPVSQSTLLSQGGYSGGVLTLSANGSTPGSGIVWSSMSAVFDGDQNVNPGILRAFDADNLNVELWNSKQIEERDSSGNWPKFSAPTVVNGRVYLASFPLDGAGTAPLNVYGLFGDSDDIIFSSGFD